jgi:acyl-CoA reductase-like NAD-dependent aldehyde dehydrogenase
VAAGAPEHAAGAATTAPAAGNTAGRNPLIVAAAQDLADYQRLTAEGKLAEAGQKLEDLKRKLEQLQAGPK